MSLYISPAYSFSSKLFVHLFLSFPSPCHLLGEGDCFLLYIPVHLFISSFGDSDFLFIYIFGVCVCVAVTANPSLFCSLYMSSELLGTSTKPCFTSFSSTSSRSSFLCSSSSWAYLLFFEGRRTTTFNSTSSRKMMLKHKNSGFASFSRETTRTGRYRNCPYLPTRCRCSSFQLGI